MLLMYDANIGAGAQFRIRRRITSRPASASARSRRWEAAVNISAFGTAGDALCSDRAGSGASSKKMVGGVHVQSDSFGVADSDVDGAGDAGIRAGASRHPTLRRDDQSRDGPQG